MIMMAMLVGIVMCSCTGEKQKEASAKVNLRVGIEELQKQLPISAGAMMEVTDAQYENDEVCITYSLSESLYNGLKKAKDDPDMLKRSWCANLAIMDAKQKQVFGLIAEAKADFVAVFAGENGGEEFSFKMTGEELAEALNREGDPKELAREYMQSQCDLLNMQVPQTADEATTLVKVEMTDAEFRYIYEIDENVADMALLESNLDMIKTNISMLISSSPEMKLFMGNARKAGLDVIYDYRGNLTGKTVVLNVSQL